MNIVEFYESFHQLLIRDYPSTHQAIDSIDLKKTISPYIIQLDTNILKRSQKAIKQLYALSRSKKYQKSITIKDKQTLNTPPKNQSVLMAYDFHTGKESDALIEINTNAAMYLITDLIHRTHKNTYAFEVPPLVQLKSSFVSEYFQFTGKLNEPRKIVIIDENIKTQNRYIEFLMFKDLFDKWGWDPEILEFNSLKLDEKQKALVTPSGQKIDLLYNRFCDFYLSRPESKHLRKAFLDGWCCITPNPFEYQLLADKTRMIEIGSDQFQQRTSQSGEDWQTLRKFVLPTYDVSAYGSHEQLWANRKQLFFKPKTLYGGKSVYRGKRISKSVFQRIIDEDFLVQRYAPAPTPRFRQTDVSTKDWKFDLRYYVYQDHIQNLVARLYKGQVTNFSTDFGGFTAVEFI